VAKKQEIIERIRENTNEAWARYGWILILSNLLFGVAFLYMVLKKRSK